MLSYKDLYEIYWKLNSLKDITNNILYERMSCEEFAREKIEINRLMSKIYDAMYEKMEGTK